MKLIKRLSDDMRGNVREAKDKIKEAYRLREADKGAADWYKEMAEAHLRFNTNGHATVKRLIEQIKLSHNENPMTSGMLAVYNDLHADLIAETAEVQAMITAYK